MGLSFPKTIPESTFEEMLQLQQGFPQQNAATAKI